MDRGPAPSRRAIAIAVAGALVAAAIVLVVAVLPAEYGVDPLGAGRALGLNGLYSASTAAAPPITAASGGPLHPHASAYRSDTRQLVVPSLGSLEFKYELAAGAGMTYAWRAEFPIEFDFHTEPAGQPPSASETFERGEASEKRGVYVAPYDGIHGWYWENLTDRDVTITLDTAGFYTGAMLFPMGAPAQRVEIPVRQADKYVE